MTATIVLADANKAFSWYLNTQRRIERKKLEILIEARVTDKFRILTVYQIVAFCLCPFIKHEWTPSSMAVKERTAHLFNKESKTD